MAYKCVPQSDLLRDLEAQRHFSGQEDSEYYAPDTNEILEVVLRTAYRDVNNRYPTDAELREIAKRHHARLHEERMKLWSQMTVLESIIARVPEQASSEN